MYLRINIKSFRDIPESLTRIKLAEKMSGIVNKKEKWVILGKEEIALETLPTNYGGLRYYFLCPTCVSRRNILYYHTKNGEIGCRDCFNLKYPSLNRSKTDCAYYYKLAEKEAQKIDPSYVWDGRNNEYKFPDRPKNMHRDKYNRRKRKYTRYVKEGDRLWLAGVAQSFK
ncbi:hypothetical protein [Atopococcus tabaci]|uniref:hypothetical protein n=1 Tax=Atopococcus tabaci TaxID=269774 RepID=UPI00068614CA|nr:hypothetical protein [Atopococcus tabaci]